MPPAALAPSAKSVQVLAEEYRAIRDATLTVAGAQPTPGYDFSAVGLAYGQVKERNHLAVMINRALRRQVIPSYPIEVQINNIGYCNLRCPQCVTHGTEEKHDIYQAQAFTMSPPLAEQISAETFPYARKTVTSGYGEGLLHKDLDVIVRNAWRYGVKFFSNTNGTTLLPKLIGSLFGVAELRLSLDGATAPTFEAVRRGARFDKVMRNVLALTRANERLPPTLRLSPTVNFGICASNTRDVPLMVDLCAFLGLQAVFGFRIVPTHPEYMDDDIEKYPAHYKHYYLQAMQRARARNLVVRLPEPAPDVAPDPAAGPGNAGMLITDLDDSFYVRLPAFEQLIDTTDLEPEIEAMMAAALEAGIARHAAAKPSEVRAAEEHGRGLDHTLQVEFAHGLDSLSADELQQLRSMHQSERVVPDCFFLQAHLIYNADGSVAPCCNASIQPVGHVPTTARDILGGQRLQRYVEGFRTGNFQRDCVGCPSQSIVRERDIFPYPVN